MAKAGGGKGSHEGAAKSHAGSGASHKGSKGSPGGSKGSPAGSSDPPAGSARTPHVALDAIEVPEFPAVTLTPPAQRGRQLSHPGPSIVRARQRLLLAWQCRAQLEPALPGGAAFFPRAFTALAVLQGNHPSVAGTSRRNAALRTLHDALARLRAIVADTTSSKDPAREALRFSVALHVDNALLDDGREVIAGARSVRARFPALTDDVLDAADHALSAAHSASTDTSHAQDVARVTHATHEGDVQLALDVLLDALDHLRAAARARIERVDPVLAAHFIAPLEHGHHAEATVAPATPPANTPPA